MDGFPSVSVTLRHDDTSRRQHHPAQVALATARLETTPIKCARYSELAWISPFRSSGGVTIPLIASGAKFADSAFSISACRNTPPWLAPVIARRTPEGNFAPKTPTIP